MELSGVALGRRPPVHLLTTLAKAGVADLTYDHVGSTLDDRPPRHVPRHSETRAHQTPEEPNLIT